MRPARLRLAAWLSLANAFAAVPAVALLGGLAVADRPVLRVVHAAVLVGALAVYAFTLFTLRALLHARGIYEADPLIKGLLLICALQSVLELPWLPGPSETSRQGSALVLSAVYWLALIGFARRLRALGDPLHGFRERLAGALVVAAVGGLALTALSIPMIASREPAMAESTPWMLATLVAAFTTLLGYARGSIVLARIFWREARA
ncbi:MAG TPA: hypothetical protein VJU81_07470 [Methylomirabilota bacterium]|nr:hypothetical protein [Methylomirabilota bacterium]